jgi:drug/metabolite transporter (DMT)-like permease
VSAAVDLGGTKLSNLFVARWTLTLALPALLLAACQLSIASLLPEVLMYLVAMVLPFGAWLLIAVLQFRLLRSHFRRPRLWMVATLAGGIVGNVAAGFAQLHSQSVIDRAIMGGEDPSAWVDSIYLYVPGVYAAIVNAAIVSMAQIACLNSRMGERLPWFLVSIAGAMFGACLGVVASHYALQGMAAARVFDFLSTPVLFGLIPALIAAIVNLTLYGVFTGLCMKRLLIRRAGLERTTLIRQFE